MPSRSNAVAAAAADDPMTMPGITPGLRLLPSRPGLSSLLLIVAEIGALLLALGCVLVLRCSRLNV
jgi:hypothetical protein